MRATLDRPGPQRGPVTSWRRRLAALAFLILPLSVVLGTTAGSGAFAQSVVSSPVSGITAVPSAATLGTGARIALGVGALGIVAAGAGLVWCAAKQCLADGYDNAVSWVNNWFRGKKNSDHFAFAREPLVRERDSSGRPTQGRWDVVRKDTTNTAVQMYAECHDPGTGGWNVANLGHSAILSGAGVAQAGTVQSWEVGCYAGEYIGRVFGTCGNCDGGQDAPLYIDWRLPSAPGNATDVTYKVECRRPADGGLVTLQGSAKVTPNAHGRLSFSPPTCPDGTHAVRELVNGKRRGQDTGAGPTLVDRHLPAELDRPDGVGAPVRVTGSTAPASKSGVCVGGTLDGTRYAYQGLAKGGAWPPVGTVPAGAGGAGVATIPQGGAICGPGVVFHNWAGSQPASPAAGQELYTYVYPTDKVPPSLSDEAVQTQAGPGEPAPYRDCAYYNTGTPCELRVHVGGTPCAVGVAGCADWYPNRADPGVQCRWGTYTVPASWCEDLTHNYKPGAAPTPGNPGVGLPPGVTEVVNPDGSRTQTTRHPDGTTTVVTYYPQPDGRDKPVAGPWVNPNPAPAPADGPAGDPYPDPTAPPAPGQPAPAPSPGADPSSGCWSLNPFVPLKCALAWAFVPAPGALDAAAGGVIAAWSNNGPGPLVNAVGGAIGHLGGLGANAAGCKGPGMTLRLGAGGNHAVYPIDACPGALLAPYAPWVRGFLTLGLYLGGALVGARVLAASIGLQLPSFGAGRGDA